MEMNIDYNYYRNVYGGAHGEEIVPYLKSSLTLICGCVSKADENVMKYAACIQADSRIDRQYKSVRLGDFSAAYDSAPDDSGLLCGEARSYLDMYGLMYRGE